MLRFIARTTIALIANAVGLLVANWLLDDMSMSASSLLLDVIVFTGIVAIIQPFVAKQSLKGGGTALAGGSALVASFVALVLTVWLSDGLVISGVGAWLLATVIIWAAALLAGVLLPMVMFKKWLGARPR